MSGDLAQRVIELEQRVRELEDAKGSYVMHGEVNSNSQIFLKASQDFIAKELNRHIKHGGMLHS